MARRHLLITRSAGVVRLYVDGFPARGSVFDTGEVGGLRLPGGVFENCAFYNRAKNEREIRALFRSRHLPGRAEVLTGIPELWERFIVSGEGF